MTTAISQFRNRVIQYVPGCPIPAVDRAIVDAMRQLCEDTNCFEKTIGIGVEFATGTGFPVFVPYTLTGAVDYSYMSIALTNYTDLSGYDPIMVTRLRVDDVEEDAKKFDINHTADSVSEQIELIRDSYQRFYRFADMDTLEIFPFEESDDDAEIMVTLSMKPSDGSTSVDDKFYNEWRNAINPLAASLLQQLPKRQWSDYDQAQLNMSRYNDERSKINLHRRLGVTKPRVFKGFI